MAQKIRTGYLVKFVDPQEDEKNLVMRVLEINIDRVLVESLVGMNINPTSIVMLKDVRYLNSKELKALNG